MYLVVGLVSALVCMTVLFFMARSQGRAPFWALFGLAGLIGLGVGAAVLYGTKRGESKRREVEDEPWPAADERRAA